MLERSSSSAGSIRDRHVSQPASGRFMLVHYKGGHIIMPNALCTLVLVTGELQTM